MTPLRNGKVTRGGRRSRGVTAGDQQAVGVSQGLESEGRSRSQRIDIPQAKANPTHSGAGRAFARRHQVKWKRLNYGIAGKEVGGLDGGVWERILHESPSSSSPRSWRPARRSGRSTSRITSGCPTVPPPLPFGSWPKAIRSRPASRSTGIMGGPGTREGRHRTRWTNCSAGMTSSTTSRGRRGPCGWRTRN